MKKRLVDAGPLLFLARLGRLDLLLLGVEKVLVPAAVLAEIRGKSDQPVALVDAALEKGLEECRVAPRDSCVFYPILGLASWNPWPGLQRRLPRRKLRNSKKQGLK